MGPGPVHHPRQDRAVGEQPAPATREDDYGIDDDDKISIQSNNENALIKTDSAYNIDLEADEAKVDSVAKMLRQLDISRAAYIEKASHIPGTCIKSSLADEAILDSSECVRRFAEDPSV